MALDSTETATLLPPGIDLPPAKRRLYETAMELFGRDGYHAVSIRDIATALGQQPSAIYFHVTSKQELLFELALMGHRSHFETIRNALLDAGADPHDQLRSVVAAHVRGHLTYPSMARLTNREMRALPPDELKTVLDIRTQTEQIFIDVLDRGVRLGAFHCDDTFLAAKAIGAMGVRLPEWWTPDGPRTPEQIVTAYTEYALKLTT
ncbi:MAG TPA: TetR/AcrR family transcriptional regulator [Acidimicrobiales bacterium]|nr:TetR/AcrR family transcriptional regulator [Acidimicrobiales bacterium]